MLNSNGKGRKKRRAREGREKGNERFQQKKVALRQKVEKVHASKVVCRRMKQSDRVERKIADSASKMVVPKKCCVDVPNLLTQDTGRHCFVYDSQTQALHDNRQFTPARYFEEDDLAQGLTHLRRLLASWAHCIYVEVTHAWRVNSNQ